MPDWDLEQLGDNPGVQTYKTYNSPPHLNGTW